MYFIPLRPIPKCHCRNHHFSTPPGQAFGKATIRLPGFSQGKPIWCACVNVNFFEVSSITLWNRRLSSRNGMEWHGKKNVLGKRVSFPNIHPFGTGVSCDPTPGSCATLTVPGVMCDPTHQNSMEGSTFSTHTRGHVRPYPPHRVRVTHDSEEVGSHTTPLPIPFVSDQYLVTS